MLKIKRKLSRQKVNRFSWMVKIKRKLSRQKVNGKFESFQYREHIAKKTKVANITVAIIRKSFVNLASEILTNLYKALVRTHLEYANQAWNPYLKKDKITIENVQRRATKFIPGIRKYSYSKRLQIKKNQHSSTDANAVE